MARWETRLPQRVVAVQVVALRDGGEIGDGGGVAA